MQTYNGSLQLHLFICYKIRLFHISIRKTSNCTSAHVAVCVYFLHRGWEALLLEYFNKTSSHTMRPIQSPSVASLSSTAVVEQNEHGASVYYPAR